MEQVSILVYETESLDTSFPPPPPPPLKSTSARQRCIASRTTKKSGEDFIGAIFVRLCSISFLGRRVSFWSRPVTAPLHKVSTKSEDAADARNCFPICQLFLLLCWHKFEGFFNSIVVEYGHVFTVHSPL